MMKIQKTSLFFILGAIVFYLIVQYLMSSGLLTTFFTTIILIGGVMAIVSLGLNLIYGFNGQFSLGQWGFYAIGAYTAADITFRWYQMHTAQALVVALLAVVFAGIAFFIVGKVVKAIKDFDVLSIFALYLVVTVFFVYLAVMLGQPLTQPVTAFFMQMPPQVSMQVIYILAVLIAGVLAAEISFIFGLPVLTLGSDYFGIATLGFTIIVKVLLDNSDTLLGFAEMKGARGMVGIPKITTWFWVFLFLLIVVGVVRNLLHSSYGRAIISVREDEIAAKAMGIDVGQYKNLAFVLGSFFAGLAGGLYAHINGFLHPDTFNFIKSFDPMIIIVFGGLGSVTGTVVASFGWALVLEGFLRLILPQGFETWRFVVYPLLLLVMMLLKPNGLFGGVEMPFLKQTVPPLPESLLEEPKKEVSQ